VEILRDVSEEDERSSSEEEEEEEEEEGDEEIESGESEEDQEVSKTKEEVEKEGHAKRQSNKLQTTSRIKCNGKTAGSSEKANVTITSIPLEIEKTRKKKREETTEEEEEDEDGQMKKDQSANKPTFTFGKSMVRDYSQPAKKYCRDKFLLGKAKIFI